MQCIKVEKCLQQLFYMSHITHHSCIWSVLTINPPEYGSASPSGLNRDCNSHSILSTPLSNSQYPLLLNRHRRKNWVELVWSKNGKRIKTGETVLLSHQTGFLMWAGKMSPEVISKVEFQKTFSEISHK